MLYQVPHNIDSNKVFLVNYSELEGRLDPSIYKPHFKFLSKKYDNMKLPDVAWIDPLCDFENYDEVSFIPMDAIDSANGIVAYKGTKNRKETKGYTRFKEGDILWAKITPCMQNAKSAIARNLLNGYGCGSTEFYVIRSKNINVVDQEYLLMLLRNEKILKAAINFFGGSAGQQRVSPIFLKTFDVPIPEIEEQKRLCKLLSQAQKLKLQKEQEAQTILNSIDDYLLSELGIEKSSDTRTENGRFFYTSFHNLMGSEWAPLCIKNNGRRSKSTLYKEVKLSTIATIAKGQAITSKEIVSGNYPVIAGGQSSPYSHNQYNYKGNIITISASGAYSGYVWYHNYPIFASDCSVIFSNDENVYLTKYIYEILRLRQQEIYLLQKGAGQPHVYPSDIANLTIPAIPLEKQQDIVAYCQELRNKAELLQKEGRDIISTAKDAIEQMIIGN